MKILIVDDERLILRGLKSCIEKISDLSCEVETATTGKQALERLEVFAADLLITDIEMPGMSGLELLEKVQQRGLCQNFIVLSGYDKFEYAKGAIQYGVKDYLLKPVDKEELRRNICAVAMRLSHREELDLLAPFRRYFSHAEAEEVPYALKKSVAFIRENYTKEISLEQLAEYTGKSKNYLCSQYKKEWNITFLDLVNEMRLKEALYLLLYDRNLPVRDVAGKVGYKTERQLFRLMKNKLGLTPQQLRNGETEEAAGRTEETIG